MVVSHHYHLVALQGGDPLPEAQSQEDVACPLQEVQRLEEDAELSLSDVEQPQAEEEQTIAKHWEHHHSVSSKMWFLEL